MSSAWRGYVDSAERSRRVRARIHRLGVNCNGAPLWTKREDRIVARLAPNYRELEKALASRTPAAIRARVGRLGLQKKINAWRGNEVVRLRKLYPKVPYDVLMESFPGWSRTRIAGKAYKLRLKRPKLIKPSGVKIIDAIRTRARSLNLTYSDLNEMTRAHSYFHGNGHGKRRALNFFILERAIHALGGRIVIEWQD